MVAVHTPLSTGEERRKSCHDASKVDIKEQERPDPESSDGCCLTGNLVRVSSDDRELDVFHPARFPSKVGGLPSWMDPCGLSTQLTICPTQLECPKCPNTPLTFLLQLYAPLDTPETFHRTIYVFVCQNCAKGVRVLRRQLSRANAIWPYEPIAANESPPLRFPSNCPAFCDQCGVPQYRCAPQGLTCHCSPTEAFATAPFPEWSLEIEEVEDVSVPNLQTVADAEVAEARVESIHDELYEPLSREARVECERLQSEAQRCDTTEEMDETEQVSMEEICAEQQRLRGLDNAFAAFLLFTRRSHPQHVVRYSREGSVLWAGQQNSLTDDKVPPCEHCGAPRAFEFQIQPSLLHFIASETQNSSRGSVSPCGDWDWGVLAIYTCSESCDAKNDALSYVEEYAHLQLEL